MSDIQTYAEKLISWIESHLQGGELPETEQPALDARLSLLLSRYRVKPDQIGSLPGPSGGYRAVLETIGYEDAAIDEHYRGSRDRTERLGRPSSGLLAANRPRVPLFCDPWRPQRIAALLDALRRIAYSSPT